MTQTEIEEYITQFPIYQYAFVKPEDIEFNDRVRQICKKECSRYRSLLVLPAGAGEAAAGVVNPLFSALMGILQTLASPMIFLSVCWGILNIGDIHMLGRIGKAVLLRFLGAIFLLTTITAACLVWLFQSGDGAASMGEKRPPPRSTA